MGSWRCRATVRRARPPARTQQNEFIRLAATPNKSFQLDPSDPPLGHVDRGEAGSLSILRGRFRFVGAGRRLVLAPDGTDITAAPTRRRIDNTMVKAIARAFRWREMLENGTYATIAEIAAAENINGSYVGRVLRLTLLAPDIIEAILGGRQAAEMTLAVLMRPFSVVWAVARPTAAVT